MKPTLRGQVCSRIVNRCMVGKMDSIKATTSMGTAKSETGDCGHKEHTMVREERCINNLPSAIVRVERMVEAEGSEETTEGLVAGSEGRGSAAALIKGGTSEVMQGDFTYEKVKNFGFRIGK
ncbi:hypothetical protein VNO77_27286 [Canavalia gladiata]|uniref:Uncharacterized protein n=1 Tax=Canavalia gladiata TaxID=3824 RepID=A0AAN9Q6Z2_CANGL